MKIMLTGATGFVGQHLVRALLARGHSVLALVRSKQQCLPDVVCCMQWNLGVSVPPELFSGVHAIVHLAHDFSGKDGARVSTDGTERLFLEACQAGVPKQILVSSYSSGAHAESGYGLAKYKLEHVFLNHHGVIVRPGLVLGEGGLFGRIKLIAQRWPVIPLPDGGVGGLPVIRVDTLAGLLAEVVERDDLSEELNFFEPTLVSLRELVLHAAGEVGRNPRIFGIPSAICLAGLNLIEFMRLRLPVSSDNLRGFLSNQEAGHISSLTSNMEIIV